MITSIDIGSFTTNIVVLKRDEKNLKVAARAAVPTRGVEHGYIVSPQETYETIHRGLALIEQKLGEKASEVVVAASGTGLESDSKQVSTIVTLGSGEVTNLDIEKSIEKASVKARTNNRRIIESLATSYVLDGKPVVGSPVGMKGKKLETTVFFIDYPITTIEIIEDICDKLDLDLLDIIPSPLACSCVSLSDIERKVGSLLVDIGSDTSEILVYEHDTPLLLKSIEFGSKDITNALALGLKVSVDEAEQIKLGAHPEQAHMITKADKIIEKTLNGFFSFLRTQSSHKSDSTSVSASIKRSLYGGRQTLQPRLDKFKDTSFTPSACSNEY